jgi:AcrR family transcriptional regulator
MIVKHDKSMTMISFLDQRGNGSMNRQADESSSPTGDSTPPPGEQRGYPRKRARTRRQLMSAGIAALAEHGPDGITIGEIARRAHVSPGTFYNHFDGLESITAAVVDELASGVEITGEQLRAIEHDAAARVAIGTQQLLDLTRDHPDTARAFVALLATVPVFRARVRSTVQLAIDDGIAAGRFADRSPAVVTDALIGAVVQWMRTRLSGESDATPDSEHIQLALQIAGMVDQPDA